MVSFIVTNYNKEKTILTTLSSIINVINLEDELLFIDDGSTDNSLMLVENYLKEKISNYRVVKLKNGGVSNARNQGLSNATKKWIFHIDGDDYIIKNEFLEIRDNIHNYNSDVIICDFLFNNEAFHKKNLKNKKDFLFSLSKCYNLGVLPRIGSVFIKRKKSPMFNNKVNLYEDLLFFDSLIGLKSTFCNKTILSYESNDNSLSLYDRKRLFDNYREILNARISSGLILYLFSLLSKKEIIVLMFRFPKLLYIRIILKHLIKKV